VVSRGRDTGRYGATHPVCCAALVLVRAYAGRVLDAEHVARLRAEGHSFRAIAALLGASLGAVQRALKRHQQADEYDDDELAGALDDYEPVPPFVFVGLAVAEDRKGNPLKDGNGHVFLPEPRAVDGRGVSVSNPELDIYRWCAHADAEGDSEGATRVRAEWARQLAEAGVRYDDDRGRWVQD
jgi:hypothetical protein